jgi:acyl-CoA synthetase (AMP-forming)/AMP-acid ligase II
MNLKMDRSGSVLVLVIVLSFILGIIGATVLYVLGLEELYAITERDVASAVYVSEAGLERSKSWLRAQNRFPEDYPPATPAPAPPYRIQGAMGNGTYRAIIYPNPADAGQQSRRYVIFSSGTVGCYRKVTNVEVRISSAGATYDYWVDPYSWNEQAAQRI